MKEHYKEVLKYWAKGLEKRGGLLYTDGNFLWLRKELLGFSLFSDKKYLIIKKMTQLKSDIYDWCLINDINVVLLKKSSDIRYFLKNLYIPKI